MIQDVGNKLSIFHVHVTLRSNERIQTSNEEIVFVRDYSENGTFVKKKDESFARKLNKFELYTLEDDDSLYLTDPYIDASTSLHFLLANTNDRAKYPRFPSTPLVNDSVELISGIIEYEDKLRGYRETQTNQVQIVRNESKLRGVSYNFIPESR